MTISIPSIAFVKKTGRTRTAKWVLFVGMMTAIAGMPHTADASQARMTGAGAYDGVWNVMFTPKAGNCHASNSVPFTVSGTHVSSAGGGKVTGGVTGSGSVSVAISVGASHATGHGRLAGNQGSGSWSGIITGDQCSGTWQAARG